MTCIGPIGLGGMDAVFFELSEMQDEARKIARDVRHEAQEAQIAALRDAADHTEEAALLNGIGAIASGAGAIGSGAVGIVGTTELLTKATTDASQKLTEGSGKATEGVFGYFGGLQNAEAKRADARAQAHGMAATDASDAEQQARSSAEKTVRRLETAQNLQSEARNAALRA